MSPLIAIAITTGILSAVWGWIAVAFGLISWVGFLGCTSYFASSGGYKALLQAVPYSNGVTLPAIESIPIFSYSCYYCFV